MTAAVLPVRILAFAGRKNSAKKRKAAVASRVGLTSINLKEQLQAEMRSLGYVEEPFTELLSQACSSISEFFYFAGLMEIFSLATWGLYSGIIPPPPPPLAGIVGYPLLLKTGTLYNEWFQKISIPSPWKGLEIPEGLGGQGSRKFLRGGGVSIIYLFFPERFHNSNIFNFCLFAFCSRAADAKINLVNSTKYFHCGQA